MAEDASSGFRWVLATSYIVLFLIHAFQFIRHMLLLKGSGYALKSLYGLLAASSFCRILQFTLFALSTFQQEATAGFLITFSASVCYFTAYMFLVYYSGEGYIVGSFKFHERQKVVRRIFHILMLLFYVLCISFMIVVIELDLSRATRFKTSVLGTALGCLVCMIGFMFLAIVLQTGKSECTAVHIVKNRRKIWIIAVICCISFFCRSLYLLFCGIYPEEVQDPHHPEYEFLYYLVSEIIPSLAVLVIAGKLSNNQMRKMTNRAGNAANTRKTLFSVPVDDITVNQLPPSSNRASILSGAETVDQDSENKSIEGEKEMLIAPSRSSNYGAFSKLTIDIPESDP
eukprot:ANDGO_01112.mRNA.1 hypothetical protein